MQAGKLKHPITIQRFTNTQNAVGEEITEWTDLSYLRCSIKTIKSSERNERSKSTHELQFRFTDIVLEDRIIFGIRVFIIETIENINELNVNFKVQVYEVFLRDQP